MIKDPGFSVSLETLESRKWDLGGRTQEVEGKGSALSN